jgi:putative transposase
VQCITYTKWEIIRIIYFRNPIHKAFFIKELKEYNKKFDYQILAYVIMDNHYHILIKTNKDAIDKIMFYINNVVVKFLCRELKRCGHIYGSRYNCKVVESDAYLLWLLRYIHRNPVRAEICSRIKEYRWCSDVFYRYNISSFVDIDYILDKISKNRIQARKEYVRLIDADGCDSDRTADFELIKELFNLEESLNCVIPSRDKAPDRLTLDDIFDSIEACREVKEMVKLGSSKKITTACKIEFLKAALYNKYSLVEISRFLNSTPDAIREFKDYHRIVI